MVFNRNGTRLATGSYDKTVHIYSVDGLDFELIDTLKESMDSVRSVTFNKDSSFVAVGLYNNNVNIFKLENKKYNLLLILKDHSDWGESLDFNDTHNLLATGSKDSSLNIYKVDGDDFKLLTTLKDHTSNISSVSFSDDGRFLVTGCYDSKVRIYGIDGNNLLLLETIKNASGSVQCVNFNFNGSILAVSSGNEVANVFNFDRKYKLYSQYSSLELILPVVQSNFDPKVVLILVLETAKLLNKFPSIVEKSFYLHLFHPLICSIRSGDTLVLSQGLEKIGYSPIFYIDKNKKYDPFYFLVAFNNPDMIKTWIEVSEKHDICSPFLTDELIELILKFNNQDLICWTLDRIIDESIPHNIQNPKILPIDDDIGFKIIESSKFLFTKNIVNELSSNVGRDI